MKNNRIKEINSLGINLNEMSQENFKKIKDEWNKLRSEFEEFPQCYTAEVFVKLDKITKLFGIDKTKLDFFFEQKKKENMPINFPEKFKKSTLNLGKGHKEDRKYIKNIKLDAKYSYTTLNQIESLLGI